MKSWTLERVNGVTSVDDESVYLPRCRRRKKAMMIMFAVACSKSEVGRRFGATKAMCLRTYFGIGFMNEAGGSFCFQAANS